MKSIAHTYAVQALNSIRNVQMKENEKYSKDYGRLCISFPSMVQVNGLRLTVAFFQSKSVKELCHADFINDLGKALDTDLFSDLPSGVTEYGKLTKHSLDAAVWFKRYAEAILKVDAAEMAED